MNGLKHRMVQTNGISMHIVEKGRGPLVLLIHGFPQLWFSWNYQINQLANHGYRVIAPDMRGYGDTDCPSDPSCYTILHLVGDIIGLLDELREDKVFVVGHDWGAEVAWHLCLFRPDRVRALVNLQVPFRPRSPIFKPVDLLHRMFGEGFYVSQFQEPGRAEKAFARYDCLTVIKKFLTATASDTVPDVMVAPPGVELIDFLNAPSSLPEWISEEELQFSATKFQKTGFTGALNYYRAMNLNWELMAAWQGARITVPSKLIVGDKDFGFQSCGTTEYILGRSEFTTLVPNLEVVIIEGNHFIQQERAEVVTREILSFFGSLS